MAHRFIPVAEDSRTCSICGCKDDAVHESESIHVWKENDNAIISLGRFNENEDIQTNKNE